MYLYPCDYSLIRKTTKVLNKWRCWGETTGGKMGDRGDPETAKVRVSSVSVGFGKNGIDGDIRREIARDSIAPRGAREIIVPRPWRTSAASLASVAGREESISARRYIPAGIKQVSSGNVHSRSSLALIIKPLSIRLIALGASIRIVSLLSVILRHLKLCLYRHRFSTQHAAVAQSFYRAEAIQNWIFVLAIWFFCWIFVCAMYSFVIIAKSFILFFWKL